METRTCQMFKLSAVASLSFIVAVCLIWPCHAYAQTKTIEVNVIPGETMDGNVGCGFGELGDNTYELRIELKPEDRIVNSDYFERANDGVLWDKENGSVTKYHVIGVTPNKRFWVIIWADLATDGGSPGPGGLIRRWMSVSDIDVDADTDNDSTANPRAPSQSDAEDFVEYPAYQSSETLIGLVVGVNDDHDEFLPDACLWGRDYDGDFANVSVEGTNYNNQSVGLSQIKLKADIKRVPGTLSFSFYQGFSGNTIQNQFRLFEENGGVFLGNRPIFTVGEKAYTFYLEALKEYQESLYFEVKYDPVEGVGEAVDTLLVLPIGRDIDVDSDNSGSIDGNDAEDLIEAKPGEMGLLVPIGNDPESDDAKDGILRGLYSMAIWSLLDNHDPVITLKKLPGSIGDVCIWKSLNDDGTNWVLVFNTAAKNSTTKIGENGPTLWEWAGNPSNRNIKITAINPGVVFLGYELIVEAPDGENGTKVAMDVIKINGGVDLDVDSLNNNGSELPDNSRTAEEDAIEDDDTKPGKMIPVNSDDDDNDWVVDFLDGYNGDSVASTEDEKNTSELSFRPIVLVIPQNIDPTVAKVKFIYKAWDPAGDDSDAGTAESWGDSTLTDTDKTWSSNQWQGFEIDIYDGKGQGQTRIISSNTATQITVTNEWTVNLHNDSKYTIRRRTAPDNQYFRLWTKIKNGDESPSRKTASVGDAQPGDYIPSNTEITLNKLGFSGGENPVTEQTFYVEAVAPISAGAAEDKGRIVVLVDPAGNGKWILKDAVRLTSVQARVYEILDGDGNSVKDGILDVKTKIDADIDKPATIRYEILGPTTQVTLTEGKIEINYHKHNEAHQFLYGQADTVVRTLTTANPTPIAGQTNKYEVTWDGRDDKTAQRLLIEGSFRFLVGATMNTIAPGTDTLTTKSWLGQQIAKPHSGHFCGDWPRASVYSITGGLPKSCIVSTETDENEQDDIRPMLKNVFDDIRDGGWWGLKIFFAYQETFSLPNETDSGTATGGGQTTLTDNTKNWPANKWQNGVIKITAGTGAGQEEAIASSTDTVITLVGTWTINPDGTSQYLLEKPVGSSSGIAEVGTANTLTDGDRNWGANQWQNGVVEIISGTGQGQKRVVTSNTATQITTTSDWTIQPDYTSQYVVKLAPWLTYTSPIKPEKIRNAANDAFIDNPKAKDVELTIDNIHLAGASLSRYPAARFAIVAKYVDSTSGWQLYYNDDPFYDTAHTAYKTGAGAGTNVYIKTGQTKDLSYDGSRPTDGAPYPDLRVSLTEGSTAPEAGAEIVVLLLPKVDAFAGKYNDNASDTNNYVEVHISGLDPITQTGFRLDCHRGYGARKFWNQRVGNIYFGIDYNASVTLIASWDSIGYLGGDPKSTDDYGNLDKADAMDKWENIAGLIEVSTHANKGFLGWYRRIWEAGDSDPGTWNSFDVDIDTELYDSSHRESITSSQVEALNLDDVLLAILGGCHTAETSSEGDSLPVAFSGSGTDIVLAWEKTQYLYRELYVRYFLEFAYMKSYDRTWDPGGDAEETIEWTNYPTVSEAAKVAYWKLIDDLPNDDDADYVYDNMKISGANSNPGSLKLYPPRYGAKDNP